MKSLLIATHNPGKILEIQSALNGLDAKLLTPDQLGLTLDVQEDGVTYRENAARKAIAYATESGVTALADDTGLEVQALDEKPGLYSARFSPLPKATDADRRAYLLSLLQGLPRPWTARFHCTVAIVDPKEWLTQSLVHFSEGNCKGEIVPIERGERGFGYDHIFQIAGLERTMAELTLEEKNRISHRGRAVRGAIPLLKTIL